MAKISERVEGTIENWRDKYNSPLKKFLSEIIGIGLETGMDIAGKAAAPLITPIIEEAEKSGQIPPALKDILSELKNPQGEISAVFGGAAGGTAVGGIISSTIGAHLKLLEYYTLRAAKPYRFQPQVSIAALQRDAMTEDEFQNETDDLGFTVRRREQLRELAEQRLDPNSVITAWRRYPEVIEQYLKDLEDTGWTKDRIEVLKKATEYYPAPADLVNWQAKEVFEPEMVKKYGLEDELGGIEREPFYRAGMTDEQIRNYWVAHWQHPSFSQIVEMLRRGLLTEQDVYDWYRLVEIPPYWRDALTEITFEIPTRVDIRRFWEMGTINETRLRELYTAHGYKGQNLEDYILWTKIYTQFPDLIARFKNGWLTEAEVKAELVRLGMGETLADEFIQTKVKNVSPERVAAERDLTKAEIYKGVKKGVITWDDGLNLLVDMGYDAAEAEFILLINVPPEETQEGETVRTLTKADILGALRSGTIDSEEAITRLVAVNYTATDATFLVDIYIRQIRELAKSDIVAAFKKDAITEADALGRLDNLGYSDDDAAILLTAAPEPEAVTKQRALTKADITKGVRDGILTREEGYSLLLDLGYSEEDATYLLELVPEASAQSPHTFGDFQRITQGYRKAVGLSNIDIPKKIILAEQNVARLRATIADMKAKGVREGETSSLEGELAAASAALLKLREELNTKNKSGV